MSENTDLPADYRRRVEALIIRYVYRSSVTGRYVSKAYAEQHPDTTYRSLRRK